MFSPSPDDKFTERIEAFENDLRKIGIYLQAAIGADPHGHVIPPSDGEEEAPPPRMLLVTALVGGEAFSDRVLNPEAHKEDTTFRELVADADPMDTIREQMKNDVEKGDDPFAL